MAKRNIGLSEEQWAALVGTMPDTVLAKQLGVCRATVLRHRVAHGVAPCPRVKPTNIRRKLLQLTDQELCAVSVAQTADACNCTKVSVYRELWRRGLRVPKSVTFARTWDRKQTRLAMAAGVVALLHDARGAQTELGRQLGITREGARQLLWKARDLMMPLIEGAKKVLDSTTQRRLEEFLDTELFDASTSASESKEPTK